MEINIHKAAPEDAYNFTVCHISCWQSAYKKIVPQEYLENMLLETVKTHLIHIYQTTGVSSIAALSSLFHGYTPQTPKNQP